MTVDRRSLLLSLSALPPLAMLGAVPSLGQSPKGATDFLRVSRVIAGTDSLSEGVAAHIADLLRARDAGFDARLAALSRALPASGSRDDLLEALDGDDLAFALTIAKPWYLGYVGDPSDRVLKDDAQFATFLEAQAYSKVADVVPFLTYPPGPAGWWRAPPAGVDASDLPPGSDSWEYQPREGYQIAPPSPAWRAYAAGDADSPAGKRS